MPDRLVKDLFTEDDWDEVQSFDCGDEPFALEVSNWLKGPFGADSALTVIRHPDRPGKIWLYRRHDEALVGFGALGTSEWRWKGKKDPKIPLTVLIWVGIGKEFRGLPLGPKDGRYSALILDDLIAEALDTRDTHPVLGLHVHKDNLAAIKLYRRAGFTEELAPTRDPNYLRMAMILHPEGLLAAIRAGENK